MLRSVGVFIDLEVLTVIILDDDRIIVTCNRGVQLIYLYVELECYGLSSIGLVLIIDHDQRNLALLNELVLDASIETVQASNANNAMALIINRNTTTYPDARQACGYAWNFALEPFKENWQV